MSEHREHSRTSRSSLPLRRISERVEAWSSLAPEARAFTLALRLEILRVEVELDGLSGLLLRRGPASVEDQLRPAPVPALGRIELSAHQAPPASNPPLVAKTRGPLDETIELLIQDPLERGLRPGMPVISG